MKDLTSLFLTSFFLGLLLSGFFFVVVYPKINKNKYQREDTIKVVPKTQEKFELVIYEAIGGSWCIKFTNDNWKTTKGIEQYDNHGNVYWGFNTFREANKVALELNTYEKCIEFNAKELAKTGASSKAVKIY